MAAAAVSMSAPVWYIRVESVTLTPAVRTSPLQQQMDVVFASTVLMKKLVPRTPASVATVAPRGTVSPMDAALERNGGLQEPSSVMLQCARDVR